MPGKRPPAGGDGSSSSKRRQPMPPAAAETDASSSSWASLQADLVRLVGDRLLETGDLLDYVRLRAVCPHWRSSTPSPSGRGVADARFHPRRWMMLPEGHGLYPGHHKLCGYIRFFNLSTGAIVRCKLPLFRNHCVLDSTDGLLLLQRDRDTAIRLLHPFTGDIAELPPLLTLVRRFSPRFAPERDDDYISEHIWYKFRDVSVASVSASADGVITVMVVFFRALALASATTKDQQWSILDCKLMSHIRRPLSFQGKLYMVGQRHDSNVSQIFQIDLPQHDGRCSASSPKLIATCPTGESPIPFYLAECDSEILLIGSTDRLISRITVYRLADLVLGRLVPVTSIGDNVLLVSDRVLSVSSRVLPNVEGNSVVLFNGGDEAYFGQYQLSSSTWSPAADGSIRGPAHSPCCLIHHIYTCCRRNHWNKGEISVQVKGGLSWKVKRKWRYGA